MPINMVEEDEQLHVIGKIRLGVKKISKKGNEYPDNVDYFVLKDAPDVERYYGESPKQIEGFFLVDDLNTVTPSWLKLYGAGVKNKDGTRTPGKLKCKGDGPHKDGRPGLAEHWDKKDRETGIAPERKCLGPKCPDFKDSRGVQQCKWAMQVLLFMPHCNSTGLYQIDTTSKIVIGRFHRALKTMARANHGKIAGYPFRLYRDQATIVLPDGSKKAVNVMSIEAYPEFAKKYGDIKVQVDKLNATNIMGVTQKDLLMAPMEDHWPMIEEGDLGETKQLSGGDASLSEADKVLQDPEIVKLFKELETLKGQPFTEKAKRMAVLKKVNEPDIKAAVIGALSAGITAARNSAPQKDNQAPPPAQEALEVDVVVHKKEPIKEVEVEIVTDGPPPPQDDPGGIL